MLKGKESKYIKTESILFNRKVSPKFGNKKPAEMADYYMNKIEAIVNSPSLFLL